MLRFLTIVILLLFAVAGTPCGAEPYRIASLTTDTSLLRSAERGGAARPLRIGRAGTVPIVEFRAGFAERQGSRAYWDFDADFDLRLSAGLRFRFHCADGSGANRFNVYLRSGSGWYNFAFTPQCDGSWESLEFPKRIAYPEDSPGGWGEVDRIRINVWKAQDRDVTFHLALVDDMPADRDILVLVGTGKDSLSYASRTAGALSRIGIHPPLVSESELDSDLLRSAKLVILPFNPTPNTAVVNRLVSFVDGGGALLGFFSSNARLLEAVGARQGAYVRSGEVADGFASMDLRDRGLAGAPDRVQQRSWNIQALDPIPGISSAWAQWLGSRGGDSGHAAIVGGRRGAWMTHVYLDQDPENGALLLCALLGQYVDWVWPRVVGSELERIGRFGPYTSYQDAVTRITRVAGHRETVRAALASCRGLRRAAVYLQARGAFQGALRQAQAARSALVKAYAAAQSPVPGEFRGVWCHRAFGVEGRTWGEIAAVVSRSGFNAIFANLAWGGSASFPSSVLPRDTGTRARGDLAKAFTDACREHGVEGHFWKVCFHLGTGTDPDFTATMEREGRLARTADGAVSRTVLCPFHPANRRLERELAREVVTNYPIHGYHLDYIRYSGESTCYCSTCRQGFEAALGRACRQWPADVRPGGELEREWLRFRQAVITATVREVAGAVRSVRPSVEVSAAVFVDWLRARNSVGQDWGQWCRDGLVGFVCPMDYTPDPGELRQWVERQLQWTRATRTLVYPGIGVSTAGMDLADVTHQLQVVRDTGAHGFVLFELNERVLDRILPGLAGGVTVPVP